MATGRVINYVGWGRYGDELVGFRRLQGRGWWEWVHIQEQIRWLMFLRD